MFQVWKKDLESGFSAAFLSAAATTLKTTRRQMISKRILNSFWETGDRCSAKMSYDKYSLDGSDYLYLNCVSRTL